MSAIQFLGEWSIRSLALMATGALLLSLLRVKNPCIRMTVWIAALAGSVAIPLLMVTVPGLPVTVWRSATHPSASVRADLSHKREIKLEPVMSAPGSSSVVTRVEVSRSVDWVQFASILYGLVSGALLLRLFVGLTGSFRLHRQSRSTGMVVEGAEVRASGQVASPVTIGAIRPAVLLPVDWQAWDPGTLKAVLVHEGSHIRRRDPALQLLSAIHRALLWASPASWMLHNELVRTAEEISDEAAVAATGDRISYAESLLEFVQRGLDCNNWVSVPMARYDRPEKRIRRILNSNSAPRGVTRRGIAGVLAVGAPFVWLAAAAHPQSAPPTSSAIAKLPEFEVATIKPVLPGGHITMGTHVYPGGRVVITAFPLKTLIETAFGLSYWQISGGDKWTENDLYIVEAKPPVTVVPSIKDLRYTLFGIEDQHLREMLQALLIDRFQLKYHRETKIGDVYLLERSGHRFKPRSVESMRPGSDPYSDDHSFGSIGYAGGRWNIFATSMPQLAKFASDVVLHVPVLDRTELSGRFNYRQGEPDLDPKYDGDQSDSFRGYLNEIGLRLVRGKGPVETFVIDDAAKPVRD